MTKLETKITCPVCKKRVREDDGNIGHHNDRSGDECPGANLPPWAARAQADSMY